MSGIVTPITSPVWHPILPTPTITPDPITLPTAGQDGYVQVNEDNNNPFWQGFLSDLIGVIPGTINAVQGTTPNTIIYHQDGRDIDENDYTPWLIAIGTIVIIGLILWFTLKK